MRDDKRHAGYSKSKFGRAKHSGQHPFELRHDIAQYRGATHPLCFTDEVMDHEFPEGFKPVNIESYDGTTNPAVWIEDFLLHIHMAHGDDLHAIKYLPLKLKGPEFPEGFKPVNIESYDGTTNPAVWIEDFLLHIHMAHGDDLHAIKYLPLKLKGPARHWLNSLPANSIGSWENLEDAFLDNFQGTYVRPPDADDLSHITQQPGESARKFCSNL